MKLKFMFIIIVLSALLCSVSIFMSAERFSKTNEDSFKNQSRDLTYTAALMVDGDALRAVRDKTLEIFHSIPEEEVVTSDDWGSDEFNAYLDRFKEVQEMPEFETVKSQLQKVQFLGAETLDSIYTIVYDDSKSIMYAIYIVDAAPEDPCLPGVVEHVDDADWSASSSDSLAAGIEPYITNTEMYGWLVTAGAPVFDSSGDFAGNVAIDLSMDDIKAKESEFILQLAVTLISLTALICIITLVIIHLMFIRPLKKLSNAAAGYVADAGNRESFNSLDIRSSDEIGSLWDAMKKMEKDIENHIKDLTEMTAEKERISAELSIAAHIQKDMLPDAITDNKSFSIYASMSPAKEIGGDLYDFFMIDSDHLALVMADVSGKGVPAALFAVIAKKLLKIYTSADVSPSETLMNVNRRLCEDNQANLFVTAWLGILDLSTGELKYSNAGHEYPAVMRSGRSFKLMSNAENMPPLATDEDMDYTTEGLTLKAGDELFLYTDGVTDARNGEGARFGIEKMTEALNCHRGESAEELINSIKHDIAVFRGNADQFDDITMLGLKYYGQ